MRNGGKMFAILSALSLILCLASAALWWRSYTLNEGWVFASHLRNRLNDSGNSQEMRVQHWVESYRGKCIWMEWEGDDYTSIDLPVGYSRDVGVMEFKSSQFLPSDGLSW